MAFYKGSEKRITLVDKLVELLTKTPTGAGQPYWEKIGSGTFENEGYIIRSSGKSGRDEIIVRFKKTADTRMVVMSAIEKYVPNEILGLAGTISGETSQANITYHLSTYNASFPVHYTLSFDKDKIMIILSGDKSVDGTKVNALAWIGMPERLAPEVDTSNGAVTIACSKNASALTGTSSVVNQSVARNIRDRSKNENTYIRLISVSSKFNRTYGWGDVVLLSKILLEDADGVEGVRGIMEGIHPIYQDPLNPDFKDGDEITQGSKRYIVVNCAHDGIAGNQSGFDSNSFPSAWMAVEQLL